MIKEYVLGFAFDQYCNWVALIEKQKPAWQKGKINGVGGKIEPYDATKNDAMAREFMEETGVFTNPSDWDYFAAMNFKDDVMGGSAIVHCFRTRTKDVFGCKTMESEEIMVIDLDELDRYDIISNLNVLIPMAKDLNFKFANLELK